MLGFYCILWSVRSGLGYMYPCFIHNPAYAITRLKSYCRPKSKTILSCQPAAGLWIKHLLDITTYAAFFLTTIYWFSFNTAMFPDNGKYPIANGISWTPQHIGRSFFVSLYFNPALRRESSHRSEYLGSLHRCTFFASSTEKFGFIFRISSA